MFENTVKRMLRKGEPAIGSWLSIPSGISTEIMAQAGFDWLLVDFEHSHIDIKDGLAMLQAMNGSDAVPISRVPQIDLGWVKRVLDMGSMGVLFPLVSNADEAALAVSYAKYPPEGVRGVASTMRVNRYGVYRREYFEKANDEILIMVQVENASALDNLDQIVKVKGIDCIFVGPMDLSTALGVSGEYDSPVFIDAVDRVVRVCKESGMPVGTLTSSLAEAEKRIRQGFTFVGIQSDTRFLGGAAIDVASKAKKLVKNLKD